MLKRYWYGVVVAWVSVLFCFPVYSMQHERVYKCVAGAITQYCKGPFYVSKVVSCDEHGKQHTRYFALDARTGSYSVCHGCTSYAMYEKLRTLHEQQEQDSLFDHLWDD